MGQHKSDLSTASIPRKAPSYVFLNRDHGLEQAYQQGLPVSDLMPVNSVGIVTARDALTIDMEREALWYRVGDIAKSEPESLRIRYALGKDVQDWSVAAAKADILGNFERERLVPIAYRPFDNRWTFYTGTSRGFQCRPRQEVMKHLIGRANLVLMTCRQVIQPRWHHSFVAEAAIDDSYVSNLSRERGYAYPLYVYPADDAQQGDAFAQSHRTLNLDPKLYTAICKAAGIDPADQAGPDDDFRAATGEARPSEVKVFDYIYGVLHSLGYRETFVDFLKIDFPRIPYPPSPEVFRRVSEKGERLRRLHLMETAAIGESPYPYEGEGDDVVASGYPKFENGKVHVNKDQYFEGVPKLAWEFYIGGYQPAQKWLKDRRGRTLSFDDTTHYQRIVKILSETDRIMKEIELPLN